VFSGKEPTKQPLKLWENEFFNESIGPVYDLKQPSMGDLPEAKLRERTDGVLLVNGRPVHHDYVLADDDVPLAGRIVARDVRKKLALRRTGGPLRMAFHVRGLYPEDTWSGKHVTYTRLHCSGGALTVQLQSDAALFARPQTVSAAGRSVMVEPTEEATLTVPLRPRNGVCRAVFTVTPTAVAGGGDGRVLGAHFLAFRYSAP
jgi:hypothetical protein